MNLTEEYVDSIVVPTKLIFKSTMYRITSIDKKYIIDGYDLDVVDGKVDEIYIKSPHPNADPDTGLFCIPDSLREFDFDNKVTETINLMLSCFNLDDCYFTPWGELKYKKL
jgi:hypothetical protein